ncbi:DUF2147 domain-containing protein [Aurantimonas sp. Leaf443]|uniref:DUF2147 domain-containing protein n=1 Tax=Aurantimonas sp. Leaf443 TaxID=1736378 RepID=UPI0007020591|nr:DUF2147 domain-containing protein [Aurantimonas sp. Leaf443]KQT88271.1 hypothetical protein ASG48_02235 [Aurantimonas sp. Leaf443]
MTKRIAAMAAAVACMAAGPALADPIEGSWKMPSGHSATIAACGDAFCLTYTSGPNKGKTFGRLAPEGRGYAGTVTDYTKGGKQYKGKGSLEGNTLSVSGCVLGGLICRSQALTRL